MRARLLLPLLGLAASALASAPAQAQEHHVSRGSYPFFSRTLTIAVNAEMPGELQILRSRAARVDIAALASPGVASFALGGFNNDELRLTAAGAERAAFIVTVPERVYVTVRAPGTTRAFGAFLPVETVHWQASRPHDRAHDDGRQRRTRTATHADVPDTYPLFSALHAPRRIVLDGLAHVRTIELRFEPGPFTVHATRPLAIRNVRGEQLAIETADRAVALVIVVPSATPRLTLTSTGRTLLDWTDGTVSRRCSPAIEQSLPGGRLRVLLSPHDGRLDCPS